jgi:hypothetical protein
MKDALLSTNQISYNFFWAQKVTHNFMFQSHKVEEEQPSLMPLSIGKALQGLLLWQVEGAGFFRKVSLKMN